MNGERTINLEESITVRMDCEMVWMKRKIDLRELAKLRSSNVSLRKIAAQTGVSKSRLCKADYRFSGE